MADIGILKLDTDDAGDFVGKGKISALEFSLDFLLDPNTSPRSETSPTHFIFARAFDGKKINIGSAWSRKLERGDFKGKPMLSMTIDYPGIPDWALNIAAFPRDDEGNYVVVHTRPRQAAQPAAVA